MSAKIVISCDGVWDDGKMPCRAFLPTRETDQDVARIESLSIGWTTDFAADLDLCPACSISQKVIQ